MLRWAGRPQTRPGGEVLRRSCSNERPIDLRKVRSSMIREPNVRSNVIDAVWRIESARVIAGVARVVRDVGLAEDLAPDALVAALEQWPDSGVPENPGAWLMAVAKRRAGDRRAAPENAPRAQASRARPRTGDRTAVGRSDDGYRLSLIHISEPTRRTPVSYAV